MRGERYESRCCEKSQNVYGAVENDVWDKKNRIDLTFRFPRKTRREAKLRGGSVCTE